MKRLFFIALAGVSMTLAASLWAQDYAGGQRVLTGKVLVEPGTQPPGRALVILYSSLYSVLAQIATDASGSFSFVGVSPGNYRVVVRLAGYQEATAEASVYRGSTITHIMPIVLKRMTGTAPEPTAGIVEAAELGLGKEARTNYQKAQQALDKGRLKEARDHLKRTVQLAPTFADAQNLLGVAETLLGDYANAEATFEQAIHLAPRRADSYFGLGRALNLLNRPGEALPVIDKGLELSRNSPVGLFEKSRAQFSLRDFASAERTARASLAQSSPPPSEVHLILANCYLSVRRYPEAATELDLYLKLEPKSTSAPHAKQALAKLKALGISPKVDTAPNVSY